MHIRINSTYFHCFFFYFSRQSNGDAEEIVSVRQGPVKVVRLIQIPANGT